ncbi:hypothetical protein ILYODFUR_005754 [Ilyodon furcidens]|uniref:Secreted protein n=1 Tax=Ilyodon furcidens TaxID=33524 RepID=A0ABV0TTZ8_9TELE
MFNFGLTFFFHVSIFTCMFAVSATWLVENCKWDFLSLSFNNVFFFTKAYLWSARLKLLFSSSTVTIGFKAYSLFDEFLSCPLSLGGHLGRVVVGRAAGMPSCFHFQMMDWILL